MLNRSSVSSPRLRPAALLSGLRRGSPRKAAFISTAIALTIATIGLSLATITSAHAATRSTPSVFQSGASCNAVYTNVNSLVGMSIKPTSNNALNLGVYSTDANHVRIRGVRAVSATIPAIAGSQTRRRARYVQLRQDALRGNKSTAKLAQVQLAEPSGGGQYQNGVGAGGLHVDYLYWTGRMIWVQARGQAPRREKEWARQSFEVPLFIQIIDNRLVGYTMPTAPNMRVSGLARKSVNVNEVYPGGTKATNTCSPRGHRVIRAA